MYRVTTEFTGEGSEYKHGQSRLHLGLDSALLTHQASSTCQLTLQAGSPAVMEGTHLDLVGGHRMSQSVFLPGM